MAVVQEVDIDEGMEEVDDLEEVSDFEDEVERNATRYRYLSQARMARMTP